MDIKKLFGKNVKEKRMNLRLTQEQLAEKAGISPKSLSQIELGNNFISAENLDALCNALNVMPHQLFEFEAEKPSIADYERIYDKLKTDTKLLDKIVKIIKIIE